QERLPPRGEIGIFNRSHYEEVLVVRVHPENLLRQKLPSETREHHVWARRYDAINAWDRYLSDNGFRIVKLFLNLSREEQRVRFLRRIDLPDHNWKFLTRRGGTSVLGRLPGCIFGDVQPHEHDMGALVCDPGRP